MIQQSYMSNVLQQAGSYPTRKRLGRGRASGHGRTSGRGREGQRARGSISPSFMLKNILKVRKIARNTPITRVLHRTFVITANMIEPSLLHAMLAAATPVEALQLFKSTYEVENIKEICELMNVAFKYKRLRFAGLGKNNMTFNITNSQQVVKTHTRAQNRRKNAK